MFLQLKDDYKIVKELQDKSGFGWDDVKKILTATPDIWEKYLEVIILSLFSKYLDSNHGYRAARSHSPCHCKHLKIFCSRKCSKKP